MARYPVLGEVRIVNKETYQFLFNRSSISINQGDYVMADFPGYTPGEQVPRVVSRTSWAVVKQEEKTGYTLGVAVALIPPYHYGWIKLLKG